MIKVNKWLLKSTVFPDGTSQVWNLQPEILQANVINITWNFEQEREILDLMSLSMLIPSAYKNLHIPYLPYARQDKDISNDSTFNLHFICKLINHLSCDKVTAVDVHNPKLAAKLIDNFKNIEV